MSTISRNGCARISRARMSVLFSAAVAGVALAGARHAMADSGLGDVFVIDMENHNWSQPNGNIASISGTTYNGGTIGTTIQQIFNNPAAPYINSLVTPGNANAAQVSWASNYTAVTPSVSIHPSEPNYLWQEAGSNFSVLNDDEPYQSSNGKTGPFNAATIQNYLAANPNVSGQNLSGLLQNKGITWKSYQEDTDLATTGVTDVNGNRASYDGQLVGAGQTALTGTAVSPINYTVPLASLAGSSNSYTNPYNGSHQFDFAAKHDGTLFFPLTNGGNDPTTANAEAGHYAPLQQLTSDLSSGNVGKYNLITPDQFNDMHTALTGGFTDPRSGIHFTGDGANISQGDNFLSIIIPQIMASNAYKNNGAIVIWMDESEPQVSGDPGQNASDHTLMEIVISPLAKGNGYQSTVSYTHSSDLKTLQEVFGVAANTGNGFLNDAGTPGTNDLADLFVSGTIPTASAVPEPASLTALGLGAVALLARRRRCSA